jgi:hypothetical protein
MLYPTQILLLHISTGLHIWLSQHYIFSQVEWIWLQPPPPPHLLQQAIHMAHLAAKKDPQSYTILVNSDPNWHQHTNPHYQIYLDTHVIAYIPLNTLQYHESINPPHVTNNYIDTQAIQVLCIHHQTTPIGNTTSLEQLTNPTHIPLLTQIAQPTPPHRKVKNDKTWHTLSTLILPMYTNTYIPPIPNYTFALPVKFLPEYSYYMDGSFKPPKQIAPNIWRPEKASYGIYNPIKNLQISERLPGLQNILIAELMAIHEVLKLSITTYIEEPVYIFTDSLNSLYLINTQLKHPSTHNNHPDKTILTKIVDMLQTRTLPTHLYKVKTHSNITGNETVDKLAKRGSSKPHTLPQEPHEFSHSTPYYLHKDEWIGMYNTVGY